MFSFRSPFGRNKSSISNSSKKNTDENIAWSIYLLYGSFFVDCRSINIGSVVCDCTRYCGVRIRRRTTFAACSPISYISRFTTLSCGSMILENGKSSNVITAISSGMRIPEAFNSFTQPNAIYWFAQITALGRVGSSSRARAATAPPSLGGRPFPQISCRDFLVQSGKCAAQTVRRNCIFFGAADECDPVISVAPQMCNCNLPGHRVIGIDPAKLVGEIRRTYNNVGQFRMCRQRATSFDTTDACRITPST